MGYLEDFGKIGNVGKEIISVAQTPQVVSSDTQGGPEAIQTKGMPISKALTSTLGKYEIGATSSQSAQAIATDIHTGATAKEGAKSITEGIHAGDTSKNVTDIVNELNIGGPDVTDVVKRVNKGGVDIKTKEGLGGDKGKIAQLGDNKVVKGIVKGVKHVAKESVKSIKATPEFQPTVEFAEQIKPTLEKVGGVARGAKNLVSKALGSKVAKVGGSAASIVTGGLTAVEGAQEVASAGGHVDKTIGGAAKAVGGTGAAAAGAAALYSTLTGTAAYNFWNPVGWISGALAIGGTLVGMGAKGVSRGANFKKEKYGGIKDILKKL